LKRVCICAAELVLGFVKRLELASRGGREPMRRGRTMAIGIPPSSTCARPGGAARLAERRLLRRERAMNTFREILRARSLR
jgi:hypothetical protein